MPRPSPPLTTCICDRVKQRVRLQATHALCLLSFAANIPVFSKLQVCLWRSWNKSVTTRSRHESCCILRITVRTHIQGGPKNWRTFLYALTSYALTSSHIDRFSNLFHCLNQENICNNTVIKDPTTHAVCRYTTLWNVSVLKATIENNTTSVTTRFKKLTTGNNVFIVSVII